MSNLGKTIGNFVLGTIVATIPTGIGYGIGRIVERNYSNPSKLELKALDTNKNGKIDILEVNGVPHSLRYDEETNTYELIPIKINK